MQCCLTRPVITHIQGRLPPSVRHGEDQASSCGVCVVSTVQHYVPMNKHKIEKVQHCKSATDLILFFLIIKISGKLKVSCTFRLITALPCKAG